jgi:hypothetical protein
MIFNEAEDEYGDYLAFTPSCSEHGVTRMAGSNPEIFIHWWGASPSRLNIFLANM